MVMYSVFLLGVIMIYYLRNGKTFTRQYYALKLRHVKGSIKSKRRAMLRVCVFFLQDNTPVYTARVAVDGTVNCGFKLLPHPLYSPDLALAVFFLFSKPKSHLCGRHFGNNDEIMYRGGVFGGPECHLLP